MPNPRPPRRVPATPTELPPGGTRRKRGVPYQLAFRDADNVRRFRYASTPAELWSLYRGLGDVAEPVVEDRRVTFGAYAELVIERRLLTGRIRTRSADAYRGELRHAAPYIGSRRLATITRRDVEQLRDDLLAGELSRTTVRAVVQLVGTVLAQAVRDGRLATNPAALVELPSRAEYRPTVLSPDQLATLLRSTEHDELGPLWSLAITTGMRRGELLGLRWRDVDLDAGIVHVERSLSRHGLGPTKTRRSRRAVELDPITVAQLRRIASADPDAPVFAIATTTLERRLSAALVAAGLPRCRFHDLRHGFAAVGLESGVDLAVVSRVLGHSRVDMTANLYTHLTPTISGDAMARVSARLRSAR